MKTFIGILLGLLFIGLCICFQTSTLIIIPLCAGIALYMLKKK